MMDSDDDVPDMGMPLPPAGSVLTLQLESTDSLRICTLAGDGLHRRARDDIASNLLKYHSGRTQAHGSFIKVCSQLVLLFSHCDQQESFDATAAQPLPLAPLCAHLAVKAVFMLIS